jgi:ornithine cyclodeaminase
MRFLNAADVRAALPMRDAVEAMKQAFAAFSAGRANAPPRIHLGIPQNDGISLVMPSFVWGNDPDLAADQALAVKVASVFERNPARGLARIQAAVLVFDPQTGRPEALLEGATVTAIRTGAASGAATDLLSRPDIQTVAVFGAGVQARSHIEAMCAVRPVTSIRIFSRTRTRVDDLIAEFRARPGWDVELIPVANPSEALRGADVVCATSNSRTPLFDDVDVRDGTHLNAIGSYTPDVCEIPPQIVVRSRVIVDSRDAAWEEAGDLIQPLRAGLITRDHIAAEIGEIVDGRKSGRTSPAEVTFFKSVGMAVQDAVAARVALTNARAKGIGRDIDW